MKEGIKNLLKKKKVKTLIKRIQKLREEAVKNKMLFLFKLKREMGKNG